MNRQKLIFLDSIDWLQEELAEAETLRRTMGQTEAEAEVLRVIRNRLKSQKPELPKIELCGDMQRQADTLLERKLILLNQEIELDRPVDWGKLALVDEQRNWHLGYHYWLGILAQRYVETGDERYAQQWRDYVEEFIVGCPYAADARGYSPSRPVIHNDIKTCNFGENGGPRAQEAPLHQRSQWMSLSCHFRIDAWLAGLSRLIDSPAIDDDFLILILHSMLSDHAYVCVMNPRENTPNQFTAVTLSLLKLSLYFPMCRNSASYFLVAWERLQRVFQNNLFPDGSDLERSLNYNNFLLDLCIEVLKLIQDGPEGRKEIVRQAALSRLHFLTALLMPGGIQPPIGKGHPEERRSDYLRAARFLNDAVSIHALEHEAGSLCQSISFPFGGYHCLRDSSHYMLFKNSAAGTGHMHDDCLSFILWHQGHELLCDSSNYSYKKDSDEEIKLNEYAAATRSHNSICVEGHGQRRFALRADSPRGHDECPLLKAGEAQALSDRIAESAHFSFLEGSYQDGYDAHDLAGVAHDRTIIQVKGLGWLIIDAIKHLPRPCAIRQHWHLASHFAENDVTLLRMNELRACNQQTGLRLLRLNTLEPIASLKRGSMDPVQGWVFPKYETKQPAWELILENEQSPSDLPLLTWIETTRAATERPPVIWQDQTAQWTCSDGTELSLRLSGTSAELNTPNAKLEWEANSELPVETLKAGDSHNLKAIPTPRDML